MIKRLWKRYETAIGVSLLLIGMVGMAVGVQLGL